MLSTGPVERASRGSTNCSSRRLVLAFGVVGWSHLYHAVVLGYADTPAGHTAHVLRDGLLAVPVALAALAGAVVDPAPPAGCPGRGCRGRRAVAGPGDRLARPDRRPPGRRRPAPPHRWRAGTRRPGSPGRVAERWSTAAATPWSRRWSRCRLRCWCSGGGAVDAPPACTGSAGGHGGSCLPR